MLFRSGLFGNLSQLWTPPLRQVPEEAAHEFARRRGPRIWNYVRPLAQSKPGPEKNCLADLSAAGDSENFHKIIFTVLTARRVDGLSLLAGLAGPGSSLPQSINKF